MAFRKERVEIRASGEATYSTPGRKQGGSFCISVFMPMLLLNDTIFACTAFSAHACNGHLGPSRKG